MDKNQLCIYCNKNEAKTDDHIPSKSLFPDPKIIKFIKVPACYECNKGFSLDEEFFRNFMSVVGFENSKSVSYLFSSKIARSARRRPLLTLRMRQKMSLFDLYTKHGIYIGRSPAIRLNKEDNKRIDNILTKYIKGLFYHHFHLPIPIEYEIKITLPKQEKLSDILKMVKWVESFIDVFSYGYGYVPGSYNSMWVLIFFAKIAFLVFVTNKEVNQFRKKG